MRKVFSAKPIPHTISAIPSKTAAASSNPSPYRLASHVERATPTSEHGADPSSIQPVSRACTVPSWRCRTAPNDLKIAPWRMSVPIATVGLNPNRNTSMGVISDPPPIPVMPTSTPMRSPASESFQSTEATVHQLH